jgi:hypothetical protein
MVKVLIDNVIIAKRINASMLSVHDIDDHLAKYTTIIESRRSKITPLILQIALTLS